MLGGLITMLKLHDRWYPCFMLKMQNGNYRVTITHLRGLKKRINAVKSAHNELIPRTEKMYNCEITICLRDVDWNGADEFCKITYLNGVIHANWYTDSLETRVE